MTGRAYPGFWSQTGVHSSGFSDMPIDVEEGAPRWFDLFEAKYTTRSLEKYVGEKVYAGKSIRDRVLFNCRVESVWKDDSGQWYLSANRGDSTVGFTAKKLIVASGMYPQENIPAFPGRESFQGPIIHQRDLGQSSVLSLPDHIHVAVLGGSKSAADMAYSAVKAGKKVSWIIRSSGSGPAAFTDPEGKGRYRNTAELGSTRLMSSLSPSCFAKPNWWHWFLFATPIGEWLLDFIWGMQGKGVHTKARFGDRPGALPGFENMQYRHVPRWYTSLLGMITFPDFYETIAQNVHVYHSDIRGLHGHTVLLEKGDEVQADVLLCGTGWRNDFLYFSDAEKARLGLPQQLEDADPNVEGTWAALETAADAEVLRRFPNLRNVPATPRATAVKTPYRLYRGIAPLDDTSIAFLSLVNTTNSFLTAECQVLWAVALLDGNLKLPPPEKMRENVAFVTAWSRRRYPTRGLLGNNFTFEMIDYLNALLGDLGLGSHRKGGWKEDLMAPLLVNDLEGLLDEYRIKVAAER